MCELESVTREWSVSRRATGCLCISTMARCFRRQLAQPRKRIFVSRIGGAEPMSQPPHPGIAGRYLIRSRTKSVLRPITGEMMYNGFCLLRFTGWSFPANKWDGTLQRVNCCNCDGQVLSVQARNRSVNIASSRTVESRIVGGWAGKPSNSFCDQYFSSGNP